MKTERDDDLLLPEEVATMLRVPEGTLVGWRHRYRVDGAPQGPKWLKIEGGRCRYRRSDVKAYLAEAAERAGRSA